MIRADVIADSVSPLGKRILTLALEYPRFIHSEFMTHRLFSRNASSSRAIPIERMIKRIQDDPAMPVHWGKNQRGMQAAEELEPDAIVTASEIWLEARDAMLVYVAGLQRLGVHKQIVNRLLEPWSHITVLVTATEWGNFFNLRYHRDAQPEIGRLAQVMYEAVESSTPQRLSYGQWHLPYIEPKDLKSYYQDPEILAQISAARCARVSYLNHEGKRPGLVEDLKLFDRLMAKMPKHASPTEHQARPLAPAEPSSLCGNFRGWVQYRKTIPGEYMPEFAGPVPLLSK